MRKRATHKPGWLIGSTLRRTVTTLVLLALAAIATSSVLAHGATEIYNRGTGAPPGLIQTPLAPGVTNVISNDDGYVAEIWPLPGQNTHYDESVDGGVASGLNIVKNTPGDIVCGGYSQGARVGGDICVEAVKQGIKTPDQVAVHTDSDPRMRGTGIEVRLQKYTPLIGPIATMNGERPNVGVPYYGSCAEYDLICNAEDPVLNPGGFLAGVVGYGVSGYHGLYDKQGLPSHTVTYEDGTTIRVIETRNPLALESEKLIRGPITPEFEGLVNELAPNSEPGSRVMATPDPVKVMEAGAQAIGAAFGVKVPELGLPSVQTPAPAMIAPPAETPAPAPGDFVGEMVNQVTNMVNGGDQGQTWTQPAASSEPAYTPPAPTYSEPVSQVNTAIQSSAAPVELKQAANNIATTLNNATNQFNNLLGGR